MAEGSAPESIVLDKHCMDLAFHPTRNVLAAGLITGRVKLFEYTEEASNMIVNVKYHKQSVRCTEFSPGDGAALLSVSADRTIRSFDLAAGKVAWCIPDAHNTAVNALLCHDENIIATGDDDGVIKIWDVRQKTCAQKIEENEDFISQLMYDEEHRELLATSGDGTISVYNPRSGKLIAMSDNMEDELLSMVSIKGGKKVVCGTQGGVLAIFSYGDWGDMTDRFPGHPHSVDTMLKINEDVIATGSSDGIIRVVQIQPNSLLGVIGEHGEYPIEKIVVSRDNQFMCSCSHDNSIKFWNVGFLYEEDSGDEEEGGEMQVDEGAMEVDDGEAGPSAAPADRKARKKQQKEEKKKEKEKEKARAGRIASKAAGDNFFAGLE